MQGWAALQTREGEVLRALNEECAVTLTQSNLSLTMSYRVVHMPRAPWPQLAAAAAVAVAVASTNMRAGPGCSASTVVRTQGLAVAGSTEAVVFAVAVMSVTVVAA